MPKTLIDATVARTIIRRWKKGLRVPEISKELDLKPQAIYQFLYRLRKNGYSINLRKAGRPPVSDKLLKEKTITQTL